MNKEINLIKTLFKGREDVFAIHWQKGKRSGYMPAYHYDPYRYRAYRMNGGTFKSFTEKTYLPFTSEQIMKHLDGEQLVGIYPLLRNNTSWFIVSDFDKQNWQEESRSLIKACSSKGIPAYLERSKSGNGGHVWIFFDQPYAAIRSRKILISMLEDIGAFSKFDKSSSFDRLFPNQNFHSGKGLGNLIALPFYKNSLERGNSCFVNENLKPYDNQWNFLSSIKKAKTTQLDKIFESLSTEDISSCGTKINSGKLHVVLNSSVILNRSGITTRLINFLKKELNLHNPEYFIKKKMGKGTWSTARYFKFIEETDSQIIIPRGFVGRLIRYCKQEKIDFEFIDERKKLPLTKYYSNLILRPHQNKAIEAATRKDFGVITAPPGSGKTVIGLKIIEEKQQPALIIVHRKQLLDQWIERIQTFLGIPKSEIGKIGQGKAKVGKCITVAMIQSLGKQLEKKAIRDLYKLFGTIIIDECHHVPAETFRKTISLLSSYYQYGLTATPFRKGSDGKQIFIHLGEIIADIKPEEIKNYKRARINIRVTALDIPFASKTDTFETLSKVLVHDSARNKLIIKDVHKELNSGKKVVLITERKEHIEALYQFLKQSCETITLSGEDSEVNRKAKWKDLNEGNYQALITTGQFFGEGTDLQNVSCLFLVYPFSFKGKLIQYIGRVQRSELTPIIYDYHDRKIDYLNKLFLKRNTYYRHLDRHASLFDEREDKKSLPENIITINKKIKVPISKLDFRYGLIVFKYNESRTPLLLEFEIENDKIRPEFDVLKPYFSKVLKSKLVEASIFAEIINGKLVSQIATSADLDRINKEIIESVKFSFNKREIISKEYPLESDEGSLDLDQLQEKNGLHLYKSESELLNSLLQNKNVRHFRQLKYLAANHESSILKLRFVLKPFSFVFLLAGLEQYHIVLETLDTDEATYIWHIDKNKSVLKQKLNTVDLDLSNIRNGGRQSFLQNQPNNFSRIIHDYSDERKGFIKWKDMLEERLV